MKWVPDNWRDGFEYVWGSWNLLKVFAPDLRLNKFTGLEESVLKVLKFN